MSVNKVILVGNVGKDPEVRYLDSGVAVASFPFATSETYKNKEGERVTTTEWHNIVLWRGLAEVAEKYVRKGSQLFLEGKIRTRSYEDKEGVRKYMTEIVADNMQMLGKKSDGPSESRENDNPSSGEENQPQSGEPQNPYNGTGEENDDLPF
jgi:single-strand DNA-binding protein